MLPLYPAPCEGKILWGVPIGPPQYHRFIARLTKLSATSTLLPNGPTVNKLLHAAPLYSPLLPKRCFLHLFVIGSPPIRSLLPPELAVATLLLPLSADTPLASFRRPGSNDPPASPLQLELRRQARPLPVFCSFPSPLVEVCLVRPVPGLPLDTFQPFMPAPEAEKRGATGQSTHLFKYL